MPTFKTERVLVREALERYQADNNNAVADTEFGANTVPAKTEAKTEAEAVAETVAGAGKSKVIVCKCTDSGTTMSEQQRSFSEKTKTTEKASKPPSSPRALYNRSVPDIGPGWTTVGIERDGGAAKGHVDEYWYSPISKKEFRSMKEVQRFLSVLESSRANGDEEAAYSMIFASV